LSPDHHPSHMCTTATTVAISNAERPTVGCCAVCAPRHRSTGDERARFRACNLYRSPMTTQTIRRHHSLKKSVGHLGMDKNWSLGNPVAVTSDRESCGLRSSPRRRAYLKVASVLKVGRYRRFHFLKRKYAFLCVFDENFLLVSINTNTKWKIRKKCFTKATKIQNYISISKTKLYLCYSDERPTFELLFQLPLYH